MITPDPPTDPLDLVRRLVEEKRTLYSAAQRLGNASWRAQMSRALRNDPTFSGLSTDFLHALWDWAEIKPLVVEVPPGSAVFGEMGMIEVGKVVAILVLPPEEWADHSIKCAVCGAQTPRWSSSTKYCRKHSYMTRDGRAYWRKAKRERNHEQP